MGSGDWDDPGLLCEHPGQGKPTRGGVRALSESVDVLDEGCVRDRILLGEPWDTVAHISSANVVVVAPCRRGILCGLRRIRCGRVASRRIPTSRRPTVVIRGTAPPVADQCAGAFVEHLLHSRSGKFRLPLDSRRSTVSPGPFIDYNLQYCHIFYVVCVECRGARCLHHSKRDSRRGDRDPLEDACICETVGQLPTAERSRVQPQMETR